MKKLFILVIFLISWHSLHAQMQYLPKFIRKMYFNRDSTRKPSFLLLPAISSAPETGLEVGGAALLSFYADTADHTNNVSNLFGYATVTAKAQTKLSLNTNYWTPKNKIHYVASIAFYNYPFYLYGVGNNTRLADADLVYEKRARLKFESDFFIGNNIYLGYVAGMFSYDYKYDPDRKGVLDSDPLIEFRKGGTAAYLGPSIIYDTRDNSTYSTKGIVVNAYFNMMHGAFIYNNYVGGFFNIEYSQFFKLSKKLILGTDVQEQSLVGGISPFYLLPEMGSDEMMRGYYEGRYRDRNYIAGQTELRYRIDARFGLAAFVGTGEVFHTGFSFPELKPNYGGGFRYFFDVEKGLAVRVDYGIGQKPAGEPREGGLYVALGQSF